MAPTPDEVKALQTPTLLVHGRDDKVIPVSSSQQLAARLPNAQLEIIPECGHWVQIERQDDFAQALINFFQRPERD